MEDVEESTEQKEKTFIKTNIYNVYNTDTYEKLDILNRKSVKYMLEVWIYNLICLFIKSRRSDQLKEETTNIVYILNLLIGIMPSIFVKYFNFFYPYVQHFDISSEICTLLASIIPHCKNTLQLKSQFQKKDLIPQLLSYDTAHQTRAYVHFISTLYTYVYCDFNYIKSYVIQGIFSVFQYRLCYLINSLSVLISKFVKLFTQLDQQTKATIKLKLKQMYLRKIEAIRSDPNNTLIIDNQYIQNDVYNPDNYFLDELIDMPYTDFVVLLNKYRNAHYEYFDIDAHTIENFKNNMWFISVFMEFINIDKIFLDDVQFKEYENNFHLNTNVPNWKELFKLGGSNWQNQIKIIPEFIMKSSSWMKYIKHSDILKKMKVLLGGILYFSCALEVNGNFMDTWNISRMKRGLINNIINEKYDMNVLILESKNVNVDIHNIPKLILKEMIHILLVNDEDSTICFFIHCIHRIFSNYYNSHLSNNDVLRLRFTNFLDSSRHTIHSSLLRSLYYLIITFEKFLINRSAVITQYQKSMLSLVESETQEAQETKNVRGKGKRTKGDEQKNIAGRPNKRRNEVPVEDHVVLEKERNTIQENMDAMNLQKKTTKNKKQNSTHEFNNWTEMQKQAFKDLLTMEQERDIVNVLSICNSYEAQISKLMRVNKNRYADCTEETFFEVKFYGLRILGELYKQGFVQYTTITPVIFPICFVNEIKLSTLSEKLMKGIVEKENYVFAHNLGEWLQNLLFYIIENDYMRADEESVNENMNNKLFLFQRFDITYFKFIINLYDVLPNRKEKVKFIKSILKEIEHACQSILFDKIKKEIDSINQKYVHFYGQHSAASKYKSPHCVDFCDIKLTYYHIVCNYLNKFSGATNLSQQKTNKDPIFSNAPNKQSQKGKEKKKGRGRPSTRKENNIIQTDDIYSEIGTRRSFDTGSHVEKTSVENESDVNYDDATYVSKIKEKYENIPYQQFEHNNNMCVTYFACLYLQILVYILSYLNYTTYNELVQLINGIQELYYVLASTINTGGCQSSEHGEELSDINKFLETMSNIDVEEEKKTYDAISKYLNRVKCIGMCLLNILTKNIVRHYQVDVDTMDELEDMGQGEKKIDDDKKDDKGKILNYYEYIYKCIEIYAHDNEELNERYAKSNLSIHLSNDDDFSRGKDKKSRRTRKRRMTTRASTELI